MKMLLQQARTVTSLEMIRLARARATLFAIGAFITLLGLGQWLHLRALPPRSDTDRFFGYAFLAAIMIGLRFGFSTDRKQGTEQLLLGNLVRPAALYLGKVVAFTTSLLLFTSFAILCAGLITTGEWDFALWYSLLMVLAVWFFTPVLLLVELATVTRNPGLATFAAFVVLVLVGSFTMGPLEVQRLLGFDVQRFAFTTLHPLMLRTLLSTAALILLYPLWRHRAGPL